MDIPHLPYFRSIGGGELPGDFGAKLVEALKAIQTQATNTETQGNLNPQGQPQPPAQVNGVSVSAQNGHLHVAIQDHNQIYRGVRYFVEHADNPNFTNPQIVDNGTARNATIPIGNQTRYVRVYSSYGSSPPSAPVYHGSQAQPTAVSGGGSDAGPAFLDSQGSGTGAAGVGLSGPGPVPYRSTNGAPPLR